MRTTAEQGVPGGMKSITRALPAGALKPMGKVLWLVDRAAATTGGWP